MYLYLAHTPPPPRRRLRLFVPKYYLSIRCLPKPLGCLPLKCLLRTGTARINDGHDMQLLRGSALLPCPSTLKLFSLPVTSGASPPRAWRCLVLGPLSPPTMRSFFIGTGRGEGRNRERNRRILRISPPCVLY